MNTFHKFTVLFFLSIAITGCSSKCKHTDHKVDDSRPDNAITYKEMAAMFHQYDIGQKKILDKYRIEFTGDENDGVESISHFYELSQLKQYIAYLERLSKEKEISLTGIRIFSAAYPKDYSDKKLRGRHTLIFMPTTKIGDKNGVAFEPLYSEKRQPIKFTKFLNEFSTEESKQVMRASFLPILNPLQDDLLSSGTNRTKPTPPM